MLNTAASYLVSHLGDLESYLLLVDLLRVSLLKEIDCVLVLI